MDGWKKAGNVLHGAATALFGILMLCILFATVAIDRNIDNPFPNTVRFDNAAYYLAALAMLCGLYHLFCLRPARLRPNGRRLTRRSYYCALALTAVAVAALQFFIARWTPLQTKYYKSDFRYTMGAAWDLAHGGSLEGYSYFQMSPNNLNITILLSLFYRLLPELRATVWLGALLTNVSAVLASLSVYNVTGREDVALATGVVGELLVALTWRAFIVYTDNFGMIFVALMLWAYTTRIRPEIKVPLMVFFAVCASYIKITNLVVFAALAANGLIGWLRSDGRRLNIRRMALYAGCTVVLFGAMFSLQNPIREHCGFKPGPYPKGWQFMFMVGQTNQTIGTTGGKNNGIRNAYIRKYKDLDRVNRAFFQRGIRRIRRRGVLGNIVFYEKKIDVAFNDGYFTNAQPSTMKNMDRSALYELYIREGRFYQLGATLFQILWDGVLSVMMIHAAIEAWRFHRRRSKAPTGIGAGALAQADGTDRVVTMLKIAILAITLLLMLFEGRAKYLYMFMPVFLMAFGLMLHRVFNLASGTLPGIPGEAQY